MATWARYVDGTEVSDSVFKILAKFAPEGTLDVFASDQHTSYLKLISSFHKRIGKKKEATDADVRTVCRHFARGLQGLPTAALFNSLAYLSPGFRSMLGRKVMLIGRLEDTSSDPIDGGRGQLAKLYVEPEDVVDKVDAFKTLVKLNPDHKESWKINKAWLTDVYERCRKLGKPLFSETLMFQRPGESKAGLGRRLPSGLVKMAKEFGSLGDFYKTQVPFLWTTGKDDKQYELVCTPDEVRKCAKEMAKAVPRPMLLLSAAVDFEQYAAQYALVSDCFAGPMCGRAYFKEAFSDPKAKTLASLEGAFTRIALPRIKQIMGLAEMLSPPWWHKFKSMSKQAKKAIKPDTKKAIGIKADYGY
ncbi:MAG: hypothetical protein GXP25_12965 [Planctomycetes bacterium]|nr:hypothetical protein [Planctomycetota bacterium]